MGTSKRISDAALGKKKCACGKEAKPHYEGGLYCGDDKCDDCFNKIVAECRQRSW